MSKKVAFLSMDDMTGFVSDDDLTIEAFGKRGILVETMSWRSDRDWNDFDAVILRSTWDYQAAFDEFMNALRRIEQSRALLMNSIDVVEWNIDKRYLAELEQNDVSTVPTIWMDPFDVNVIYESARAFETDELIVKPTVSANADNTFRFTTSELNDNSQRVDDLKLVFARRSAMIQPFVDSVLDEGEYSLFVIGNELTHAVVKKPKKGDYRVQEEHGGAIESFEPDQSLRDFVVLAMSKLPFDLLYARIDVVRHSGQPHVMELELIEPSLYFRFSDYAIQKFVASVANRLDRE